MPGWILCRPLAESADVSPGGIVLVRGEPEMRPTTVEVVSVGPPKPHADGSPGWPLAVKSGDRVLVPEYGVKVHESPRGDLRCYEHSQVLARLDPDDGP